MGMLRFARFYQWLLGHGNTRKYTEGQNPKNFLPQNLPKNTKKQALKTFCHGSTRKNTNKQALKSFCHGSTRKYTEEQNLKNFLPRKHTELFPEGIYFSVCFRVFPWQLFLSWTVLNDTFPR